MNGPQAISQGIPTVNKSGYKLDQESRLPESVTMIPNLPPGTDPCNQYSIQGNINSAAGEEYTAKDILERFFLRDGAPYQPAILDNPDQKISAADRDRLARPENMAKVAALIRDHNGGALISGEINLKYALYLYSCSQQQVEQGSLKQNPNENVLASYLKFFTHGPQGQRPPIRVPVRQLAKLINELPPGTTAAKQPAPQAKPTPAGSEPRPPIQPVVVDKPAVKPNQPENKPEALPFMPF
jgi:hypothetical protein